VRDIEPGDEVVVSGTGEHGTARRIVTLVVTELEDGSLVWLDSNEVRLAGDEAP
jgi:hypothetical protein